ncbi:MAG TPA: phage tail protein [Chitinophagaceae bacterium]|nr:phage tail protein [Chitinophagaceae bacterium]
MTNNGSILADSIAHLPHLAAFDLLVKKRFSELELDKLLVYLIDTVDSDAIPYLAEQFDVLGYKGFKLATTEADQREIIKRSIELHRYKGTLWAVREALTSIGFGDAVIVEHVDDHWAKFRVTIELGGRALSITEIDELVKMISEYKNTRSHLADLSYTLTFDDTIIIKDEQADYPSVDETDGVTMGSDFRHNGLVQRDGSRNYSKDADILTIDIETI